MQGLIVLSLCNTYSYPLGFFLCSFFAGQGHIQEIPNISRPGQVERFVIWLMLAAWRWGSASISRKTCTNLVLVLKMHIFALCNK